MSQVGSNSTAPATAASSAPKIGVIPPTLMVAGNMMGSGAFMLPAILAATGRITLFATN